MFEQWLYFYTVFASGSSIVFIALENRHRGDSPVAVDEPKRAQGIRQLLQRFEKTRYRLLEPWSQGRLRVVLSRFSGVATCP
jgi:hypothetical protein